ncbi:MAG: NHL repeat-containing protein [Chloroflexota bacterium]|nr:NHL repeat-containing protein [Chloroflexota bacterium]
MKVAYDRTVGIVAMEGRGFSNPVDLAISSESQIYVVSRTNTLQTFGIRIGICTIDGKYFGDFGEFGDGDGAFVWPTALAFDQNDRLYLTDEYNHRVTMFNTNGSFISKWGTYGTGDGQLNGPAGIAIGQTGEIFVSDHLNNRIACFTSDGNYIKKWGQYGNTNQDLDLPWGITASDTHVYVADWRNDRIQQFTYDGEFVNSFGETGDKPGQFYRPSSVAVDTDRYIYVADWGNERVQILDPDGGFVQELRGQADLSVWAEEFYEANDDEKSQRDKFELIPEMSPSVQSPYEISARTEPYFWGPISVKLDPAQNLYVTETNRHRIQVYSQVG